MKIPLDVIEYVLKQHSISPAIASEIKNKAMEIEEEKEVRETVKKQYAIIVSDPNGLVDSQIHGLVDSDLVGWVVQIPEDESVTTAVQKISDAAREFNMSPKGRRMPVRSIGEAIESVSARLFREEKAWVKTKEPVLVLFTDNKLLPRSSAE